MAWTMARPRPAEKATGKARARTEKHLRAELARTDTALAELQAGAPPDNDPALLDQLPHATAAFAAAPTGSKKPCSPRSTSRPLQQRHRPGHHLGYPDPRHPPHHHRPHRRPPHRQRRRPPPPGQAPFFI